MLVTKASKNSVLGISVLLVGFLFIVFVFAEAEAAEAAEAKYIGIARAQSIALEHAKVSERDVRKLDVELDRRAGRAVYEVEFDSGGMEYEYKIDAVSGEILRFKTKRD
jgi:uncharacterized membrane protein YkoI